jgi:hypothetical protein
MRVAEQEVRCPFRYLAKLISASAVRVSRSQVQPKGEQAKTSAKVRSAKAKRKQSQER